MIKSSIISTSTTTKFTMYKWPGLVQQTDEEAVFYICYRGLGLLPFFVCLLSWPGHQYSEIVMCTCNKAWHGTSKTIPWSHIIIYSKGRRISNIYQCYPSRKNARNGQNNWIRWAISRISAPSFVARHVRKTCVFTWAWTVMTSVETRVFQSLVVSG